jgi:hypothetical protein
MRAVRMRIPNVCNSPNTSLAYEDAAEFQKVYKAAVCLTIEAAAEEKYGEFHRNLYRAGDERARQLFDTYQAKVRSRKMKMKTHPLKYVDLP